MGRVGIRGEARKDSLFEVGEEFKYLLYFLR